MTVIIITQVDISSLHDKLMEVEDHHLFAEVESAIRFIRKPAHGWPPPHRSYHIFLDVDGCDDKKKRRLKRIAKSKDIPEENIRLATLHGGSQISELSSWLDSLR